MMLMTPFAASVPYRVAALGPFNTSIDSMSSGLKSLMREIGDELNDWLWGPVAGSLFTRTPSTKSGGLLRGERLAGPGMRICEPVPTWPDVGMTTRLGVRPL